MLSRSDTGYRKRGGALQRIIDIYRGPCRIAFDRERALRRGLLKRKRISRFIGRIPRNAVPRAFGNGVAAVLQNLPCRRDIFRNDLLLAGFGCGLHLGGTERHGAKKRDRHHRHSVLLHYLPLDKSNLEYHRTIFSRRKKAVKYIFKDFHTITNIQQNDCINYRKFVTAQCNYPRQ